MECAQLRQQILIIKPISEAENLKGNAEIRLDK